MDISAALSEDLAALSRAAGIDQELALAQLGRGLQTAVPSYLGLSITLVTYGQPVTLTALRHGSDAVEVLASLHFPIAILAVSSPESTLTVYAALSGAFVDLAADLHSLADSDPSGVQLDQHLRIPDSVAVGALVEFSTINQAAGVLIAAGFEVADAYAEIESRAERTGTSRFEVAGQILDAASDRP